MTPAPEIEELAEKELESGGMIAYDADEVDESLEGMKRYQDVWLMGGEDDVKDLEDYR